MTQLCTLVSEKFVIGIIRPCHRLRHAPTSTCKAEYIIEHQTDDGWQSIFWEAEQETAVWNAEAVRHSPGDGFTWDLTLTQSGLERGWYHVCEPLTVGTYRFVYFGMLDDHALGAEFAVTQD